MSNEQNQSDITAHPVDALVMKIHEAGSYPYAKSSESQKRNRLKKIIDLKYPIENIWFEQADDRNSTDIFFNLLAISSNVHVTVKNDAAIKEFLSYLTFGTDAECTKISKMCEELKA